jgi:hypothetical protein
VYWNMLSQTKETRAVFGYTLTGYHKLKRVEQSLDILEHITTNGQTATSECIFQRAKKMGVGGCYTGTTWRMREKKLKVQTSVG